LFLFVGAVSIGGAAVREGTLEPGDVASPKRRRNARLAMAGTGILVALMLFGGWTWWNATDTEFRNRMYRPFAARASGPYDANLTFAIVDSEWTRRHDTTYLNPRQMLLWSPLIRDHGKLMHLFLVADTGSAFAHLHPMTADTDTFTAALPEIPTGR